MTAPDFIITNTGIAKQVNNHHDNEIDMITRPDEGTLMISDLYESCDMDKPTRFKFILAWFSEPSLDYREIEGTPDEETMMRDCLNQWSFLSSCYDRGFRQHFDEADEVETTTKETSTCACSQYIENRYYFRNKHNGNVLLIGSSCLKKFASETTMAADYDQVRKILRSCDNCGERTICTEIVNGFCRTCYPDEITEEDKTICLACLNLRLCKFGRCKKCYQEEKPRLVIVDETMKAVQQPVVENNKVCQKCKEGFFAVEDWKKICLDCYRQQGDNKTKKVATGTPRECQHCKQEFLADQEWKKTCSGCYKLLSKVCIKCNQGFMPKGTWQKACYKCWQAGQKK